MKIKSSIRYKLILAIFIGCLVPYFGGGVYLNSFIKTRLYQNNIENSNQLITQVNELFEVSLVSDMQEEVSLLASLDSIKNVKNGINQYMDYHVTSEAYQENAIEKEAASYFSHLKDSHSTMNFIFLGTQDGGYMEYPKFSPTQSYDPRLRPWYMNTIETDAVIMSEPYITNMTKDIVVSFTKRVKDGDEVVGVVGISVKIEELTKSISKIEIGETGYILVMSMGHKFIVSPKNPEWIMKTPQELGLEEFKISEEKRTNFEAKLGDAEYIFNSMISDTNGLHIISVMNKSEILHNANEITNILIIIYFTTLLLIFIILFQISKRMTKPILEISAVINRMTDFDFDFEDNTGLYAYAKHTDEIGTVSSALIEMHNNYKELITQVNNINNELCNIDIEKNTQLKAEVSVSNPFQNVIGSMNVLMDKINLFINKLKANNQEMQNKNELLTSSEEELTAQLEEIEAQQDYINFIAFHDSLTGLPNRRSFLDCLENKMNSSKEGAVILLDIDDFKGINDIQGHVFGDRVLEEIANRLQLVSEPQLFVSRFGGDEFLILYESNEGLDTLENNLDKVCHAFDEKIQIDQIDIEIRISMGVSVFPGDSNNVNQLVMNADLAMYAAKNSGKNRYRLFDATMMDNQIKKANIEAILSEAINNDGFKMVYQPQVDLKSGEIHGYEALLRLKDFNISPAEFVDVAEKNGTIIKIGRIVTHKVIEQLFLWKALGMDIKPVSLNFSGNQLHDMDYIEFLKAQLQEYRIETRFLEIEITENIFLENQQATLKFLKQLKEMGIRIAIDDFGTGYSSLNYLTFLPVDIVKLDRSLSLKFLEIKDAEVMDSLISLIHSLGHIVLAEGIETHDQMTRLHRGNCDYIQGFYFSRPLEADFIPDMNKTKFIITEKSE